MIVDSPNSSFWQAVYDCAQEWAQKNDAILELRGSGRESDYSKLDYMNMSIASNSDGIILQYSGEQGLEAKINEAVQKGIPVVTVMAVSYTHLDVYKRQIQGDVAGLHAGDDVCPRKSRDVVGLEVLQMLDGVMGGGGDGVRFEDVEAAVDGLVADGVDAHCLLYTSTEVETINSMIPIWKRKKSEVSQEEYDEFYKTDFHDFENPARTISVHAEGSLNYDALMFVPSRAPVSYTHLPCVELRMKAWM